MTNLQASKAKSLQDTGLTVADRLRQEGRQEGMETLLRQMICRGMSVEQASP